MNRLFHAGLLQLLTPRRIAYARFIQSCYQWDEATVREYQEQRLKALVAYCWKHVPFYRASWSRCISSPQDIRTLADLEHLPTLTKDDVRNHIDELSTRDPRIRSTEARTGGSTGRPVIFRMTRADEELMWAQMYVAWSWAGFRIGAPFLIIGGESVGIGLSDRRSWKDRVINRWVTSGSNLTLERTRALANSEHFSRIQLVYGYPNAIREFCEYLSELGIRPSALRGVVCTAEVMRPEVRERISTLLGGVPVHDQYGLNDGGLLAAEGPARDGLHVFPHRGILEITDDKGMQIQELGKTGKVVATCLTNLATPFVRYETGDEAHWYSKGRSNDGIEWPRIGPVDGRAGDVIYLPSGRKIAMPGLTLVMRWLEGLRSYQFIQTGPDSVTAIVRPDAGTTLTEDEVRVFLMARISDEIDWRIEWGEPQLTVNQKLLIIRNDWLRNQGVTRPPPN